jgi:cytochrome b6-f complex iron-sulfur subunit
MSPKRPGLGRRELLGGAAALAAIELAAGCVGKPEPSFAIAPVPVTIPAAELAEGGRQTVMLGKNPVEVRRGPGGVTALMLRCTHTGCVVRWRPAESTYVCPCHDGRFGADGSVISGPPPLRLRAVPVRLSGGDIVVGA